MFELIQTVVVTMQYSVVILLVIISFQALRAFRADAFRIIAFGWLANLAYLIFSVGSGILSPALRIPQSHVAAPAAFLDFVANALFWYAAHRWGKRKNPLYFSGSPRRHFLLLLVSPYVTTTAMVHILPQRSYGGFFVAYLPMVLFDALALMALASYFQEVATQIEGQLTKGRILYFGTLLYATIQILHLGTYGSRASEVAAVGFLVGLVAKLLIFMGIIRLLVASAETLIASSAERKRIHELGGVINVLAHELATPINEIVSRIEDLSKPSSLAEATRKIESAASRAESLLFTTKLLIRRVSSDNDKLNRRQSISANTLLEIAQNAVKTTRRENVTFEHQYAANCCIECVPNEIIQVLINLFRNSYDALASSPRKKISVRTLNDRAAESAGKTVSMGKIRIVVRDNGEGISEENMSRIFSDGFSTRSGEGRGHGLVVVKKLVEKHNGTIEVNRSPVRGPGLGSHGTELTLTFPRVPCE
jgi:signal transduction histidine kinase